MAKEVIVSVDPAVSGAFYDAWQKNSHLRGLNPDVATRWAIDKQLHTAQQVTVTASLNGGPIEVHVNGEKITNGSAMTRRGLESVVDVYSRGKGSQIAQSMLSGSALVLSRA